MYESLSTTRPKAKKRHQCFWCSEWILPGEQYVREIGVFDEEFQSTAYHPECDKAAVEWCAENHGETFSEGEFTRGSTTRR